MIDHVADMGERSYSQEVGAGERFEFGRNWARFLETLDEHRIVKAEETLKTMLGRESFAGRNFLDIGSGSGLFSLAARRLGMSVFSMDYDPNSVACTEELKRRYFPADASWTVTQASVLDQEFLHSLGTFDTVYSWGVLHHTGSMWRALRNIEPVVAERGQLFIAIYNDQGKPSRRWLWVKKVYNSLHPSLRFLVVWPSFLHFWLWRIVKDLIRFRPVQSWSTYHESRGMSPWHDVIDWVGGYPFEVAKPEEIFDFYHKYGFALEKMTTQAGGLGCNEFVFIRK